MTAQRPTFHSHAPRWPIRLVNAALIPWSCTRRSLPGFDALRTTASSQTGLEDFGDPMPMTGFASAWESIRQEGNLTPFGRITVSKFYLSNLRKRLRFIEALKRHPEIAAAKLNAPIIVTGWYRSGTTYLHNLLARLSGLRAPAFWELRNPCPAADPGSIPIDVVKRQIAWDLRIHRYIAPDFNEAHPMELDRPDECFHLFEQAGVSSMSFMLTEATAHAHWLLKQDLTPAYRDYRLLLQVLHWLRPGGTWVLKWPYHYWHLDRLIATFPDARIIVIHRRADEVVPSSCSLAALARAPFCRAIDNAALGQFWLDYCAEGQARAERAMQDIPPGQLHEVQYPELIADPQTVVSAICQKWGLPAMAPIERRKHRRYYSRHHYGLEQFGLSPEDIDRQIKKNGATTSSTKAHMA